MPDTKTITLKSAVDAYLAHLADSSTKATTVKVYERALELAITHFGADKKLTGIMVPHVGKFFNAEIVNFHPNGKPKAEPTVKQIKRVFRQCMTFCKEQDWITIIPVPKAELQHARSKKTSQEPDAPKVESPKENTDGEKAAS